MSLESKLRNIFLIGMSSLALSCGGDKSTGPITPSAAQNNAPTVTSISPKEVQERFDYSAKIIAADADGDDLTFSLVEKPDWLSISGNNLSGLAPEVQRDSTFSFKVRVSDGKSSGELSDSVTVKNISNTYVVTEESPERIMSVGENQITFLGVPNFEEGDIVASGITEETPYGLLRKVTSVSGNVVYTEQGTLEEAVKHGSFHFTGRITPDMVNQKAARKGVSFFQTPLFDIGMNLDEMLEEGEFGQTEINGSVGLSIGYDLEADFEKRKLKEFLFTLTATGKYDLNVIS
ncbi:MAG: hypothetical protein KKB29_00195, partial [Nanoarchaeota archaeon]|nr:hypothetical protein [Nanoarchaeota archaeon]